MMSIVLIDFGLYSALHRVGINSDLRRLVLDSVGFSFIVAGGLELKTMPTLSVGPMTGRCQVRLYNTLSCCISINSDVPELNNVLFPSLDTYKTDVKVSSFLFANVLFESKPRLCSVAPYEMILVHERH